MQRSPTSKIFDVRHLDYWARLKELNLFTLERSKERYAIRYIYKMLIGNTINIVDV